MSMNCTVRQEGDVTVLDLSGRITLNEEGSAPVLHDVVRDAVQKGSRKLLLNLRHVTYVDSGGLGELVSCVTTVQNHQGELRLCSGMERVRDLLRITYLDSILRLEVDEPTALQALATRSQTTAA